MNIQNRLKHLESQINRNDSDFCGCEKETQFKVIVRTADGKEKTLDGKPYEEPPERCESCGKRNPEPIEATFVIKTRENQI